MNSKYLLISAAILLMTGNLAADLTKPSKRGPAPRDCLEQGEPLDCQYPPAYNAPATIDVCYKMDSMNWPTNVFFDFSFTYWWAGEGGLNLATNAVLSGSTLFLAEDSISLGQSFDYHPGFKGGIGFVGNHEWVLYTEYTWFRGSNKMRASAPTQANTTAGTGTASTGTPVWAVDDWFLQRTPGGQSLPANSISSLWRLGMDLIDMTISRPYYQGRYVIMNPFAGLRGAWIRQTMNISFVENTSIFGVSTPTSALSSHNRSQSWAVGPRAGFSGYGLFPLGFRFEGDVAASVLYTRYSKIRHKESRASLAFNPGPYKLRNTDVDCLRPALDLGLGLGWGTYYDCQRYHIDFLASYEFNLFWDQNMMRKLLDDASSGTGSASDNLYLHGLTFTARLDF